MAPPSKEYKCTLADEDLKYLLDNYGETEARRTEAVQELQEWLQENPHIGANTSPRNLLRFLRHSKYRLDACKKRIENFYLMRSKVPEWFQDRDVSEPVLRDYLESGPMLPLLKKDAKGRTTFITRYCMLDPYRVSQNVRMKLLNMIYELATDQDETTSIYGVNIIVDCSNLQFGHVLTPAKMKKAVFAFQDCYPYSPKRIDFIFTPLLINVVMSLLLRFMSSKLRARVHVHGYDLKSLHAVVPPEILPEEYGGTAGTVQELTDHWKREALEAKDWFLDDEKYCTSLEEKSEH